MDGSSSDTVFDPSAFDLLVVGGGINGCAIARDAAGRGLRVLLVERDDLAAHTSSASTKLIHGGLRYLEQYEFALVGKALAERERVLRAAPHIVWPLRFVLPQQPHLRPAWMIRLGLFLYDRLGGKHSRQFPRSHPVDLRKYAGSSGLKDEFTHGFVYSDAWVMDARLCVLNAMDAREHGADIRVRTACTRAWREGEIWKIELRDANGDAQLVQARALVNATGPWAARFLDEVAQQPHAQQLRLVKGSHIVVPKLFEHERAYLFQQPDRRIVFAIPFERDYTLIGTTDVECHGDPAQARIDSDEIDYLCAAASRYFKKAISARDVVWSYSGVRPLLDDASDDASEVTRDYKLDFHAGGAPLLNVFGGKITTARQLAEDALDLLAPALHLERATWTGNAILPGGDIGAGDFATFAAAFAHAHPWLPQELAARLCRHYGTRAWRLIGNAASLDQLGECFGADLHAAEVDYLIREEWARGADDILWRRTKLGLRFDAKQVARLQDHIEAKTPDSRLELKAIA